MRPRADTSVHDMKGLRASLQSGFSWTGGTFAARALITLAATTVLARVLDPESFGLMGMAMVVVALLAVFGDLGIGAALIQRDSVSPALLATAFWTNAGLGLLAFATVFAIAPLIAALFREPELAPFVSVMAGSFVFSSLSNVHSSLLQRELRFKEIGLAETVAVLLGACAALAAAFKGAQYWSLAIQQLVTEAVRLAAFRRLTRWQPAPVFSLAELRSVAGFSLNLTGFSLLVYLSRNLDRLLIGRYLGAEQLGYYALAYRILLFPLQGAVQVIARVMFAALSRAQREDGAVGRAFLKIAASVSLVAFPALLGLGAVSEPLVDLLFGPGWQPVAELLAILSPVAALTPLAAMEGALFQAKGATGLLFRWNLAKSLAMVIAMLIGLQWGLLGVAVAHTIAVLTLAYPAWRLCFGLVGLSVGEFAASLRGVLLATSVMLILVKLADTLLLQAYGPGARLAGLFVVGLATYLPAALLLNRELIRDALARTSPVAGASPP